MTHEIKKAKYIGYLWKSDQQEPEVLQGDKEFSISLNDGENPFVIEGNLWDPADPARKNSISIKFVDGNYIVKHHTLTDEDLKNSDTHKKKTYIAHRLEGVQQLEFMQFWKEEKNEENEFCEGMTTLIPDKLVFVGFGNNQQGGEEI